MANKPPTLSDCSLTWWEVTLWAAGGLWSHGFRCAPCQGLISAPQSRGHRESRWWRGPCLMDPARGWEEVTSGVHGLVEAASSRSFLTLSPSESRLQPFFSFPSTSQVQDKSANSEIKLSLASSKCANFFFLTFFFFFKSTAKMLETKIWWVFVFPCSQLH